MCAGCSMMFKLENSRTQNYDIGRYSGRWGDLGNGKYNNPVLAGDFSDPDIIRVGADYFLICSTMQLSPGLTVLHSRDLVNWRIINNAARDLTQISPDYNWDKMNGYSRCVWAPCITYNKWNFDFVNSFYYSFDGINYVPAKDNIQLRGNDYRGDYIGFYNYNNISESGYVDIDYIKVESN